MDGLDKKIQYLWNSIPAGPLSTTGKCPGDLTLSHYIEGALDEPVRESVEAHLLECSECMDVLILFKKKGQVDPQGSLSRVPESWMLKAMNMAPEKTGERLFDIVLKFARDTIEVISNPHNLLLSGGPQPLPVRGEQEVVSANHILITKVFGDIKAEVVIERADSDTITIRMSMKEGDSGPPDGGIRVNLFDRSREIASFTAEDGHVCFSELNFGKYVLKVMRRGNEIGQISFNLKS